MGGEKNVTKNDIYNVVVQKNAVEVLSAPERITQRDEL